MHLSHNHQSFATVRTELGLIGLPAMGMHHLIFEFMVDPHVTPLSGRVEVLGLEGTISMKNHLIGRLSPSGGPSGFSTSTSSGFPTKVQLSLELDARRLERLSDEMPSGMLYFDVRLHGLALGPAGLSQVSGSGPFTLAREHWLVALSTSGFGRTVTSEVLVPEAGDDALKKGVTALGRALRHRASAEPHLAVADCRVAIEDARLDRRAPKPTAEKKATDFTVDERLKHIRAALFSFCCPPHHSVDGAYGRDEARLATALTAALLEHEARTRAR